MKHFLSAALYFLLAWSTLATAAPAPDSDPSSKKSNELLVACVSEDNAPFSSSGAGGIDVEIATEIAHRLSRTSRISWVDIPRRGGLGRALRQSLSAGQCDMFVGIAMSNEPNEELEEQSLAASVPYMSAAYMLVAAKNGHVRTLDDARQAARVGAVSASPADLYLFRTGFRRLAFGGNATLLDALVAGEIDAALVWSPALASARERGFKLWPDAIINSSLDDPSLRADFVIATRKPDAALATQVNAALAQMRADGFVQALLARHGMPDTPVVP